MCNFYPLEEACSVFQESMPSTKHPSLLSLISLWFVPKFWSDFLQEVWQQLLMKLVFPLYLGAPSLAFSLLSSYDILRYQLLLSHYIFPRICQHDLLSTFSIPVIFSISLFLFPAPSFGQLRTEHVFPSFLSITSASFFEVLYRLVFLLLPSLQLLFLVVTSFFLICNRSRDIWAIFLFNQSSVTLTHKPFSRYIQDFR